jgi:TonB-linked SusC/RagA family outer membrane protein
LIVTGAKSAYSQNNDNIAKGVIVEAGTKAPLQHVAVSVASTGTLAISNENGEFSIAVPNYEVELIIDLPGYTKRQVFLNKQKSITITLVPEQFKSFDKTYNRPLGSKTAKDETYAVSPVESEALCLSNAASFDDALQGIVPGLHVIRQSGLLGQKSFINIRGFNSLVGSNEPLLIIDGMIHDYNYAKYGVMEGSNLNPFDIVDIDDIADLTVIRNGESHFGSAASNGVIYLNTEQKSETSTLIKISAYSGIVFEPKKLDVLSAGKFNEYYNSYLSQENVSQSIKESAFSEYFGPNANKYKYDNNTNWQNEIFKPGILQKYHIFLKGGDDIATYNISAGFINHDGSLIGTSYNRFNLRVNGRINISDKFSVTPNVKLSLGDTYSSNMGPTTAWNPVVSALLKPAIMAPNARDVITGQTLPYLEDVGVFNVSNPVAIVNTAIGINRNYHFLSSIQANYKINENFSISNLLGLNFNNSRENIFLPDNGLVQIDSAANSPKDFVYEFRSTQNHLTLNYNKKTDEGQTLNINAGMRYLNNTYKHNIVIDLNTPSDDFKNLGQGSKYNYLRKSLGDNRDLTWVSVFANGDYSIQNKYFFNANLSVDASSALNAKNRYNIFPSLSGAWRLSSEEFMAGNNNIEDLKLRASWSMSGNMFTSVYDYSKLYYTESRLNATGVLVREAVPNENLKLEKNSMFNIGIDYSGKQQQTTLHADLFFATTHNLIIRQELPPTYGYTEYYNNGGKLANYGAEIGFENWRKIGEVTWTNNLTANTSFSMVTKLDFINPEMENIITNVEGASYITSVGHALNAFYGYETKGIFKSDDEAKAITGPNGVPMRAGDIKFDDKNGDKIIDELDKTIIGNPNPFLFGAWTSAAAYKRWEFKATFTYSVGNQAYNYVRYKAESMDTYASQLASVSDSWSANNTNGELPRVSFGDPTGNTVFSDRWIEDASYLKIKQLTVSYKLPQSKYYSGVSLYCTASNLLTLSRYSGFDPEFYYLNDPFYMGIDYGKVPHSRSFIVGVKLSL